MSWVMFEHTSADALALYAYLAGSSDGVAVFLMVDKAPVVGEPISFTVNVINKQNVAKTMKMHLNAQAKEYNHSPSDTFWETHGVVQLAPMDGKIHSHPMTEMLTFASLLWFHRLPLYFVLQLRLSASRSRQPSMRMWWEMT